VVAIAVVAKRERLNYRLAGLPRKMLKEKMD